MDKRAYSWKISDEMLMRILVKLSSSTVHGPIKICTLSKKKKSVFKACLFAM